MAMQFMIVRIQENGANVRKKEKVLIDGQLSGKTNERLRVEEGTHTIKLENAEEYTPQWRRPTVTGTTVIKPMEVTFELS